MELLRNKFLIGTLCVILGLAIGFVAIPQVRTAGLSAYVTAIRVKQGIPAGSKLDTSMLESVKAPENAVPHDAVSDISAVAGTYAAAPLFAGDFVTPAKVTDALGSADPLAAATAKGMRVMSLPLASLASGVSGKLRPGDIVTVLAYPKTGLPGRTPGLENRESAIPDTYSVSTVIYPELRYLEVCSVSASDGSDADVEGMPENGKNRLPATVTLYVTEEQAMRLSDLEQEAVLHLVFVARGKDAAIYIPDAGRILNTEVR